MRCGSGRRSPGALRRPRRGARGPGRRGGPRRARAGERHRLLRGLARAGRARPWWRWTSRASSWPRPAASSAGSDRGFPWSRETPNRSPSPTPASTWWSASTGQRPGATRSAGCRRRRGCCVPVAGWSSSPTATSPRSASPRRKGSRRRRCFVATARPPACTGRGRDRVPSLARRLGAAPACLGLRRRGAARALRAPGRRRPPVLRDRVGGLGEPLAGRGAVGGHPAVISRPLGALLPGRRSADLARATPRRAAEATSRITTPSNTRLSTICSVTSRRMLSVTATMSPKPTVAKTVTVK